MCMKHSTYDTRNARPAKKPGTKGNVDVSTKGSAPARLARPRQRFGAHCEAAREVCLVHLLHFLLHSLCQKCLHALSATCSNELAFC